MFAIGCKNWLMKYAHSDRERIENNIKRLEELKVSVHELKYFVYSSNSGGYFDLNKLLKDKLVLGRPNIYNSLKTALIGENNQKIALDAPHKFAEIMNNTEDMINGEIVKEKLELRKLNKK